MPEEKHIDNAAANGLHGSRIARRSCHEHNCSHLEIQPNPSLNVYLVHETMKVISVTEWASPGNILKMIRNKREHGFKTYKGRRDQEILNAARLILEELSRCATTLPPMA
jgi:hypothetical protein